MDISNLEQRVNELEHIILGCAKQHPPNKCDTSIIDDLSDVHKQLVTVEKRVKIDQTLNRSNEICKYMDPHFLDDLTLSNEAKIKIILSQEENIVKMAAALESLQKLQEILNRSTFTDLQKQKSTFASLLQRHVEQENITSDLVDESTELLQLYTDAIGDMSKLLTAWNKKIPSPIPTANS